MDYTNVLELLKSFIENLKKLLEDKELIGIPEWVSVLDEINGIHELLNDPVISKPLDNYKLTYDSPIDRYGIANVVIAQLEQKYTPIQISKNLELQGILIEDKEIRRWIKEYTSRSIEDKIESTKGSVFDTQTQLQSIFESLHSLLDKIEYEDNDSFIKARTTKFQVQLDYAREIRMAIKDASTLSATVASMQTISEFQKIVVQEVNRLDPATAQRIWRRIQQAKSMFNNLDLM